MASILREWLAPLANTHLRLALAEFNGYVPGTHLQKGNLTCSPDLVTVHLKKKRAIQVTAVSDTWTSSSLVTAASDGTGYTCATFEQDGIAAFQKKTGRNFQSIKGAIIIIDDYQLIFHPNAELHRTVLLNVLSFALRGSEGSATFGVPSPVVEEPSIQQMVGKLRHLLSGQSKSVVESIAPKSARDDTRGTQAVAAMASSQPNFNTQVMATQPLEIGIFLDEKREAEIESANIKQQWQQPKVWAAGYDGASKQTKTRISKTSNLAPQNGSALASVPREKLQQVTSKLEAKFNEKRSQSTDSSHSVKSRSKKSPRISPADQENYLADLDSPSESESEEEDDQPLPQESNESDEVGQKSVVAINTPSKDTSRLWFIDSFQSTAPFEGLKRVPRKYVRIPREQHAFLNDDSWFKPQSHGQSAQLPESIRQGLAEFVNRETVGKEDGEEEGEEDSDDSSQSGQEDGAYALNKNRRLGEHFEVQEDLRGVESDPDEDANAPEQADYEQIGTQSQYSSASGGKVSGGEKNLKQKKTFGGDVDDSRTLNPVDTHSNPNNDRQNSNATPSLALKAKDLMPVGDRGRWVHSQPATSTQSQSSHPRPTPTDHAPKSSQRVDLNLAIPIAMGDFLDDNDDEDFDFFPSEEFPSTAINKSPIVQVDRTPYVESNLQLNSGGSSLHQEKRKPQNVSSSPVIPATHIDLSSQPLQSSAEHEQNVAESSKLDGRMGHGFADETAGNMSEKLQLIVESTNQPTTSKPIAKNPIVGTHEDLLDIVTSSSEPEPHQKTVPLEVPKNKTKATKLRPSSRSSHVAGISPKDKESHNERRKRMAKTRRLKEENFWKQNDIPEKDSKLMAEEVRDMFFSDLLKHKIQRAHQSTAPNPGAGLSHFLPPDTQPLRTNAHELATNIPILGEAPLANQSLPFDQEPHFPSSAAFECQVSATIPPLEQAPLHHRLFLTSDRISEFDHAYHIPSTDSVTKESPITYQTNGNPALETSSSPIIPHYSEARVLLDDHLCLMNHDTIFDELAVHFNDPQVEYPSLVADSQRQPLDVSQNIRQYSAHRGEDVQPETTQNVIHQPYPSSFLVEPAPSNDFGHQNSPPEVDNDFEQEYSVHNEALGEKDSAMTSFENFQLHYPEYTGSQKDFTLALVYMEWLSAEGKIVNTMLCDEFIRFYPEDYNALNGAKMQMSGWELFNKKVKDTNFRKQVITVDNFQDALVSLNCEEVERMRAIFDRPGSRRSHEARAPPYSLNSLVQARLLSPMLVVDAVETRAGDVAKTFEDTTFEPPTLKKKPVQRQPFFETPSQIPSAKRKQPAMAPDSSGSSAKRPRRLPWSGKEPESPKFIQIQGKITSGQPSPILGNDDFRQRSHGTVTNVRDFDRFKSLSPLKDANRRKTLHTSTVMEEKVKKSHSRMSITSTPGSVNVGPNPLLFRAFLERQSSLGLLSSRSTPNSTPSRTSSTTK